MRISVPLGVVFDTFALHVDVGVIFHEFGHHWINFFNNRVLSIKPAEEIHFLATICAERKIAFSWFFGHWELLFANWTVVWLDHLNTGLEKYFCYNRRRTKIGDVGSADSVTNLESV